MFTLVKKALKLILSKKQYVYLQKKYWKLKKWHPIKKFKGRILKHLRLAFFYPLLYSFYSKKPIENEKVIFIEPKYEKLSNNFYILHKELTENYDYKIYVHFLREFFCTAAQFRKNCRSLIKDIATAKYVFIDEGSNMMGRIKFRKETQIVQLWHACGAFKKFGFSTAELIFGTTRKEMLTYPHYKYSTLVSVSSPEVIWAYSEAMGIDQTKIQALGVSRTDIFFNEAFKKAAREKFELFMPSSVGKKVILFAPTFRGRVKSAKTATAFSIPQFYEALSDEYVLVLKHHPHVKKPPTIPEKYRSFAVDFTKIMDIEELLCVADICISDYSSLIFEYSLFERPMIFFAYDIDEYFDWRGFYYNYDELTPGPVFKTNREMIDYIQHIDERFDKQQVIDFRNKFMASCDGHSTERIMHKVFGDDLQKHLKAKEDYSQLPETSTSLEPWEPCSLSKEEIWDKLLAFFPEINGKKIIAYFMCKQANRGYPSVSPYLNWQTLYEYLPEDYIVLYLTKGKIPVEKLPQKHQKPRFISVKGKLSAPELAAIADYPVTNCWHQAVLSHSKAFIIYLPQYRWFCQSVAEYESSTALLRTSGYFYEDTLELIHSIENNKPSSDLSLDAYKSAYQEIWSNTKKRNLF